MDPRARQGDPRFQRPPPPIVPQCPPPFPPPWLPPPSSLPPPPTPPPVAAVSSSIRTPIRYPPPRPVVDTNNMLWQPVIVPVVAAQQVGDVQQQQQQQPVVVEDPAYEEITEVEWAEEHSNNSNSNLSGELAKRGKYDRDCDPCGCTPNGDEPCCSDMSCVLFACQEECWINNCTAGEHCRNQRITKKLWKDVDVVNAGLKGKGLMAKQPIQSGDFILEYVGRAISRKYLETLFRRYRNEQMLYIMALDKDTFLDARKRGGKARYINHSCDPNCIVDRWKVKGILRAGIFALKDIQMGEELSFDYKWDRKRGRAPTKCHCKSDNCRGTLEVARSMEEEELEQKLMGHWKKTINPNVGREIVNRSIKILSEENHEYFSGDVCRYDDTTGQHLIIYRHDLEESWEDLKKEDWMILDEEAEQFVIAKKSNKPALPTSVLSTTSLVGGLSSPSLMANMNTHAPVNLQQIQQIRGLRNYFYLRTPVKEAVTAKQFIERLQRLSHVAIDITQCTEEVLGDTQEAIELNSALLKSKDGCVWKFTVSGFNLPKAIAILAKNVDYHKGKVDALEEGGILQTGAIQEVIIPRCIVDIVKTRLQSLVRGNTTASFLNSDSKSKQFAKLILESSLVSDLHTARDKLWRDLVGFCKEVNAPFAQSGIPKDLVFLGGQLTSEQFQLLHTNPLDKLSQEHNENFRGTPFFTAFESTNRCTVWVQAQDDKGRINEFNVVVNEASHNEPRNVYFGCEPRELSKLWAMVVTRASELVRGVKYLHLGRDKVYQQLMMQSGDSFFEYIERSTGASVTTDLMTGNHLRIDAGPNASTGNPDGAALAEELVRLQIELYRDNCIRQQSWVFGRDWTMDDDAGNMNAFVSDPEIPGTPGIRPSTSSGRNQFDSRSVSNACMEIAEITFSTESDASVAAHASIIMYRFLDKVSPGTQLKLREILVACVFLASKAQKATKWKRLEILLEAAYKTFYPGSTFKKDGEEATIWEKKVHSAESEILMTLDYDIFWRGSDWIITAAVEAGRVSEPLALNALEFAFSGPVLGAGKTVWLKYGPEYVFAAAAGFLSVNIEFVFSALSLTPLRVSEAAGLIANSIKASSLTKRNAGYEPFNGGKKAMLNVLPHIHDVCINKMNEGSLNNLSSSAFTVSESSLRFKIIASREKSQRTFRSVDAALLKGCIIPSLDGVSAESKCSIFFGRNTGGDSVDITLEGNWRAIAIAEHLLRDACEGTSTTNAKLPTLVDVKNKDLDTLTKISAKQKPGLLKMNDVSSADGWNGTIQSSFSTAESRGNGKPGGGKACVAGKVIESQLQGVGLRWWIPSRYGPSPTGSICDMLDSHVRSNGIDFLDELAELTSAFMGDEVSSSSFPLLTSKAKIVSIDNNEERNVAVSLQRWPSQKVSAREQKANKRGSSMEFGFSPAALQELQLLMQLHTLIPSPQGHPNFMLPVALALPSECVSRDENSNDSGTEGTEAVKVVDDDMFSLFRTSEQNEVAAEKEKKRKDMLSGPHLVFQPTPFGMHRFTSRSKKRRDNEEQTISSALVAAWFHDLLSALAHCHTSNVILRNLQPDQILIDHCGVAKLSGLYRATVLPLEERTKRTNPLKSARAKKGEDMSEDGNPYAAPEVLLGSKKHTKETDVWSLGCLMAHLLLNKPLFIGRDGKSLLLAVYKIVGTPNAENFEDALRFPNFVELKKKYKRGVVKALQFIMKDTEAKKHSGALELLSRMLHLDPLKRITAAEALSHDYMTGYIEKSSDESFRQQYVKDWTSLKSKLTKSNNAVQAETQQQENTLKRKANFLMAASAMDNDEDDLYDMDDLLGGAK